MSAGRSASAGRRSNRRKRPSRPVRRARIDEGEHDAAGRAPGAAMARPRRGSRRRLSIAARAIAPGGASLAVSEGEETGGARSSSSTERVGRPRPAHHPILPRMTEGHVIIIGGAEDKVRERVILSRFVTLAGGRTRASRSSARPRRSARWPAQMYRQVFARARRRARCTRSTPRLAASAPSDRDGRASCTMRRASS